MDSMTIGLLSINMYTKSLNFACPIHTWAFQHFLKQHGFDSTVISYLPNYNDDSFPLRDPVPYYEKKYENQKKKCGVTEGKTEEEIEEEQEELQRYKDKLDGYSSLREERAVSYDKFEKFIGDNYKKTDAVYSAKTFDEMDPGFDCYICVDDVVWAYDDHFGFDPGFLLDCRAMDGKRKIAYAVSRGVPRELEPEQEKPFFDAVSEIDYIGVRERNLKKYIETALPQKRATVVLDAVLLNEAQEYEELIVKPAEERYVLLYYAMERPMNLFGFVEKYAAERGLLIVEVGHLPIPGSCMADSRAEVHYRYDIGPGEWLGYIKYAECVFTNSFHALCFSMLFHKNFFVGVRGGDKLANLLSTFGLRNRAITALPDQDEEIDYSVVDEIMQRERKKSIEFILSAIRGTGPRDRLVDDPESEEAMMEQEFPVVYRSMTDRCGYVEPRAGERLNLSTTSTGYLEYRVVDMKLKNSGQERLISLRFTRESYSFIGWHIKAKVGEEWYWVTKEGTLLPVGQFELQDNSEEMLFGDGDVIPYIKASGLVRIAACAVWKAKS